MSNKQRLQTEVGRYISSLMQNNFGENPDQINVIIQSPFIIIHLHGFSIPSEKILMKRNEWKRIWETRDLIMNEIKSEVITDLKNITDLNVEEFYADWNFEHETGLFIAVLDEEETDDQLKWPENIDKEALKEKIIQASKETQKAPDYMEMYWLNERIILVERRGIMVQIEKELIKNGVIEELRLAKRPLEHKLMNDLDLHSILKSNVHELFVDWNFEGDKAFLVFILEN